MNAAVEQHPGAHHPGTLNTLAPGPQGPGPLTAAMQAANAHAHQNARPGPLTAAMQAANAAGSGPGSLNAAMVAANATDSGPGPLTAAMQAANSGATAPGPLTAAMQAANANATAPGPLTAAMQMQAAGGTGAMAAAMMSPGISSGLAGGASAIVNQSNGSVDLAQLFMAPEYSGNYTSGGGHGLPTAGQKHVADVPEPVERPMKKARALGPRAGEAVATQGSAVEQAQRAAAEKAERFADERKNQRAVVESGGEEDVVEEGDANLAPDELRKKRYLRRLELNRQSAAVSRVRRREYVKELEDKLVGVEKEKYRLQGQVDTMGSENMRLRAQMRSLQAQLGKPEPDGNRR